MSRWTEWTPETCDKTIDLATMGIAFTVEARTRGDAARLRELLIDRIVGRGIAALIDPPDARGNVTAKVYGGGTDGTITIAAPEPIEDEWVDAWGVDKSNLPRTRRA